LSQKRGRAARPPGRQESRAPNGPPPAGAQQPSVSGPAEPPAAAGADIPGLVILSGVGIIGLGMALVIAGILAPPLFRPGTFAIGIGMLLAAAGGALRVASPKRPVPS
jgi:hypothetical protein